MSKPEASTDASVAPVAREHLIPKGKVKHIPLDKVDLDDTTFMFRATLRLGPLERSIQSEGQQIPIIVRRQGRTRPVRYQIVSGYRRASAMHNLGFTTIAAIVRDDLDDDEAAFRASVVENEQRKTYSDLDRALVLLAYGRAGYTGVQIHELMGLTRRQQRNLRSLLTLPDVVKAAIDDPDDLFTATHGIVLRQYMGRYPDIDPALWVASVNAEALSISQMKRAITKASGPEGKPPLGSIFNPDNTEPTRGIFRLTPIKVVVAELDDEERAQLKAELTTLIQALG